MEVVLFLPILALGFHGLSLRSRVEAAVVYEPHIESSEPVDLRKAVR
jgi:hypothetical protein